MSDLPPLRLRQAERRAKIIGAYLGGASARDVATEFGVTLPALYVSLHRWGVRLPDDERRRRASQGMRSAISHWPDCPEHQQADYATLRKYMGARAARAQLEGPLRNPAERTAA